MQRPQVPVSSRGSPRRMNPDWAPGRTGQVSVAEGRFELACPKRARRFEHHAYCQFRHLATSAAVRSVQARRCDFLRTYCFEIRGRAHPHPHPHPSPSPSPSSGREGPERVAPRPLFSFQNLVLSEQDSNLQTFKALLGRAPLLPIGVPLGVASRKLFGVDSNFPRCRSFFLLFSFSLYSLLDPALRRSRGCRGLEPAPPISKLGITTSSDYPAL